MIGSFIKVDTLTSFGTGKKMESRAGRCRRGAAIQHIVPSCLVSCKVNTVSSPTTPAGLLHFTP